MCSEIVIPNRSTAFEGLDVVDARYQSTVFGKHIHEEYTIGIIEAGAQKFLHKKSMQVAVQNQLVLVNPDDVHTGETASPDGWRYRAMYPTMSQFSELYNDLGIGSGRAPYFRESVVSSPDLARDIRLVFDQISLNVTTLHAETLLYALLMKLVLRLSTGHEVSFLSKEFATSLCKTTGWEAPSFVDVALQWHFETKEDIGKFLSLLHSNKPEFSSTDSLLEAEAILGVKKTPRGWALNWPMTVMMTTAK